MFERMNMGRALRTFRPQVIAWRTSMPGPWTAPRLRATATETYVLARMRRAMRPVGLGSERLYWAARPPLTPRGDRRR